MIYDAEHFAKGQHHGQKYGDHDYSYHLEQVVAVARQYSDESRIIDAAWLHDIIEDTSCTYFDVAGKFGGCVANMVWACTGFGSNRKEKIACINSKLPIYPGAALVKSADRIANIEFGLSTKNYGKWSMYMVEHSQFCKVVEPYIPAKMFERLQGVRTRGREIFDTEKH